MSNTPIEPTPAAEADVGDRADIETTATDTGLDENVAGALTYVLGIITGVLFFLLERENAFVRFHAAQSIAVFGLLFVGSIGLSILGMLASVLFFTGSTGSFIVGSLVSLMLTLLWLGIAVGGFGLWIYLMIRAYQGETPRIPIAAKIADALV